MPTDDLQSERGVVIQAIRRSIRFRYIRARATGGRLLRQAPFPDWVRLALRRAIGWLPPAGHPPAIPGRHPASPDDPDYAGWLRWRALDGEGQPAGADRLLTLEWRPLISVVMPVHDPELRHLELALGSVEAQIYPEWELCIADDASTNPAVSSFLETYAARQARARYVRLHHDQHIAGATNAALALAEGEFVAFLDHDDELTPDALLEVVSLLQAHPEADVVYSDHDILDEHGYLRSPRFKPDWSPELLLSYMYFGHLKVYRTRLVKARGGLRAGFEGAADYDLALRVVEHTDRIHHVPRVLYHWRAAPRSMGRTAQAKPYSFESGRRAVEETLQRRGIAGAAVQPEFARQAAIGVYKVQFRATHEVPVTIVIPTRDRVDLLRACIESIETKTTHRAYEILIIDNESREQATRDYLARSPHRVLPFASGGRLNFAGMMNHGVAATRTEHIVLLNNDTLVITPEWLDELVGYGCLPGVGAVGAKLLYPDGRIQHAGVVLGIHGLTGHAFQPHEDGEAPLEYECYAHVARNYLAVTAACMLTRRRAFDAVGGFDDRNLRVAWNDVDYCLRLREHGYRVVSNPYARLYHLESQSRGDDKDPAEVRFMMAQWKHYIDTDPFYNPNLSRRDSEFRIKTDPEESRFFYYQQAVHGDPEMKR